MNLYRITFRNKSNVVVKAASSTEASQVAMSRAVKAAHVWLEAHERAVKNRHHEKAEELLREWKRHTTIAGVEVVSTGPSEGPPNDPAAAHTDETP
jgi:hypothetical protein